MLKKVREPNALDKLLIKWVTTKNLPFRIIKSTSFQNITLYLNPAFKGCIPLVIVLQDKLDTLYKQAQGPVTELLTIAQGRIHVTFDSWTSRNCLSLLKINIFFINVNRIIVSYFLGCPQFREDILERILLTR